MALSDKHRRFAEEYIIDLNATAAYARAGYKARGHAAETNASRLLRNAEVAAAVAAAQAGRAARNDLTADLVVKNLREEAQFKGEASSHSARIKAWELLGRHIGMWPNKVEHSGGVRVEVLSVEQKRQLAIDALRRSGILGGPAAAFGEGAS